MKRLVSLPTVAIILCALLWGLNAYAKTTDEAETAELLIVLLKAGRAVVSEHQNLINDAARGDKGFTDEVAGRKVLERFKAETRIDLTHPVGLPRSEILLAMVESQREVIRDAQPVINKEGIGFKGFVPSMFARKVGQKLYAKTGIRVKLTAMDYRFPGNQPDNFETEVLRVFSDPHYPKGKRYVKLSVVDDEQAVRVMYPEYAEATCLVCHGDPRGERDMTGMKKEGWKEGELAGAISVVMPVR
jgi:general secretion pathway protein A